MSKIPCISLLKTFFVKGSMALMFFMGTAIFYSATAEAKICFLPGGKCPGETMSTGSTTADNIRAVQGDQCLGYNLTQIKCKDQACEDGWDCESCVNAQGTFYKCTKKDIPEGFTPGLEKCDSPCQRYTWNGFTGNKINGRCDDIENFTPVKPNPCRTYIAPNYVCGVSIEGADVSELTKDNDECQACYTNITEMSGYTTDKPASCTTYNSRRNGLQTDYDTMCYTAGVSIGDYFSTTERDQNVFVVETKYGVDTFTSAGGKKTDTNTEACYRATGCNAANGWLPAGDVDGNKFEFSEKSSDGVTCRKAIACKESNNWFNQEKLGQFKNSYFATQEETRSGLTCYNTTGCHIRAYSSQPDIRYFKSSKKTSNGIDCWIVTGKADYAYDDDEKEPNYFDYDNGKEAYLNGTDEIVKYYLADKCMKYSYSSQPDAKYFTFDSVTRKQGGTNTDITCWIITGKAEYAYDENEKVPSFFAYDSGKEGYLNATSTIVKYFNIPSCNTPYSYADEPDAKYFSYVSETRKKGGTNTDITCWNITGKGEFAYTESEKKPNFFAYDNGKEGYLNGTATTGKYFDIASCGQYAYSSEPDKTFFTSVSDTKKKGGVNVDITCWNVTGKGPFAYKDNERKTSFFDYDQSTAYINGTSTQETFYRARKCSPYAYTSEPDAKYFSFTKEVQKKDGVNSDLPCWNITGKGKYAYTEAEKKPLYFKYDAGKEGYLNGTPTTGKYFLATALADGAYPTSLDTKVFRVNKEEAYKGGIDNLTPSWRAIACNADNHYTTTKPDARYFASTSSTASDITCYIATGCISGGGVTNIKPTSCRTWDSITSENITCYYNISGLFGNDCTTGKPPACKTFNSKENSDKVMYYYNITTTGANDCTTTKPTDCRTWETGTDSNNNKVYFNISNLFGGDCTTVKPVCQTWSSKKNSDGILYYYGISQVFGSGCTLSPQSCYKYSSNKDSEGTTYYYNPVVIANGAVATKPSVSNNDCHTFSSGAGTNGVTCYWNIGSQAKPADAEKCGTCGYHTRPVTCDVNGAGWNIGQWSNCTETTKDVLSAACGCGGTKTRTATCAADGKSWNYSEWSACSQRDCYNNETCKNGKCVPNCTPGNGKFGSVCCQESDCGYSSDSKLHCYNGICHECQGEGSACVATGNTPNGFLWNGKCTKGECVWIDPGKGGCTPGNGKFGSVCCQESDCGYSSDSKLHCYNGICHECQGEGSACVATGKTANGFLWNGKCTKGECVMTSSSSTPNSGGDSSCTIPAGGYRSACSKNSDCKTPSDADATFVCCPDGRCRECCSANARCYADRGGWYGKCDMSRKRCGIAGGECKTN